MLLQYLLQHWAESLMHPQLSPIGYLISKCNIIVTSCYVNIRYSIMRSRLQLGVGKSDFGSGCSGFNPFGLEDSTQSGSNYKPDPNQTEFNSVRFGLGYKFRFVYIMKP